MALGIDPDHPQTNAVIINGRAYLRSDAGLQILHRLPGWSWTRLLFAVPAPARDFLYDRLARNRYSLFGRTETCLVPNEALAHHVLPDPTPLD